MTRPPLASLAITVIIEITAPLVSYKFSNDFVIKRTARCKVFIFTEGHQVHNKLSS